MIKAAVFDLDHTLFDRYKTLERVVPMLREQFEISEGITDEYFTRELIWADKNFVHRGWEEIFAHLCECGIFKVAPTFDEYTEALLSCFKRVAVPFDFAVGMLDKLRKNGIKTGLITNGRHEVQIEKLKLLGLENSFDAVIISGDFDFKKPDRQIFEKAAELLSLNPAEMLYIGDHPLFDVDGSRRAGFTPVWVKTTGTWIYPEIKKPELSVETTEEIPALIKKLNKIEKN